MKCLYVAVDEFSEEAVCTFNKDEAIRFAEKRGVLAVAVNPPDLRDLVLAYYKARGLTIPSKEQAMLFLVSEIGELADEMVQAQSTEWVRNNPQNKGKGVEPEIGDVLMMLTMTASRNPIDCMLEKFVSKGVDFRE